MSYTLCLEIQHKERLDLGWYSPAIDGAVLHPRTKETAGNAAEKLIKLAQKNKGFIQKYRIAIYEGRVLHYHKDRLQNNLIGLTCEADND